MEIQTTSTTNMAAVYIFRLFFFFISALVNYQLCAFCSQKYKHETHTGIGEYVPGESVMQSSNIDARLIEFDTSDHERNRYFFI